MHRIIEFLRFLLHTIGLAEREPLPAGISVAMPEPEPRRGKIDDIPLLVIEKDHLVMVLDHRFDDLPSWAEWDSVRKVMGIAHMGGQIDEVDLEVMEDGMEVIKQSRRLLLVSNSDEPGKKLMHFVPFLMRE